MIFNSADEYTWVGQLALNLFPMIALPIKLF